MSTTPDSAAREHLKQAGAHIHEAVQVCVDRLVDPQVRSHLRQAARSVLEAGLAAVDAAERRDRERHAPAAPSATVQPA